MSLVRGGQRTAKFALVMLLAVVSMRASSTPAQGVQPATGAIGAARGTGAATGATAVTGVTGATGTTRSPAPLLIPAEPEPTAAPAKQETPAPTDKNAKPAEGGKPATGATGARTAPATVRGERGRVLPAQPGLPDDLNNQPEFKVGPGDSLSINVWKEPEVSGGVTIRGDCRITLPLIKEVEVCGMTPTEIQDLLVDKLSKFIAAPDVTVVLGGMSSRKIYFIGNVKRPGGMVLLTPTTIAQALSDAGGLGDYANDKAVIIMRNGPDGKPMRYVFNYREYIRGKSQKGNILLQPGDTVIVH